MTKALIQIVFIYFQTQRFIRIRILDESNMDSKQRPLYCRGVAIGVVREPIEASLVDYPDVFAVSRERIDIVGNTYAEITAKMARVLQSLRYYTQWLQ